MPKHKRIKSGSSSNRERPGEEEEEEEIWRPFSRSLEEPSSDVRTSSPFVSSSYNEGPIDLSMHPPVTSCHSSSFDPQGVGVAGPSSSSHYEDDQRNLVFPSASSSTNSESSHRPRRAPKRCGRCRFHGGTECLRPEDCPWKDCNCSNCRGNPELDRLLSTKKMKDLLKLTKHSKDH